MERIERQHLEQLKGETPADYTRRVTPLLQERVERLCVAVLEQLVLRRRAVRVAVDYRWGLLLRKGQRGWLYPRHAQAYLTARVDGILFQVSWNAVRSKDDEDVPENRIILRIAREIEHEHKRGHHWNPSGDCVRLLEPKDGFDVIAVTEALERYLVQRVKLRDLVQQKKQRAARRAATERQLRERLAPLTKLGAQATVSVERDDKATLRVTFCDLDCSTADKLPQALAAALQNVRDAETAAHFEIPE